MQEYDVVVVGGGPGPASEFSVGWFSAPQDEALDHPVDHPDDPVCIPSKLSGPTKHLPKAGRILQLGVLSGQGVMASHGLHGDACSGERGS